MQVLNIRAIQDGRPVSRMRRLAGAAAIVALASACLLGAARPARASSEDAVKAAFVFNFAKLTTFPSSGGPIVIGVIGSSSAGDTIESVVNGKSASGRSIVVKHIGAGAAKGCQMVFVCAPGGGSAAGSPSGVLTVGESPGFAGGGGCIGFTVDGGKVRFEINTANIKRAHLQVDGKLVNLAKVVG